jgi:hypothetical protein
MSAPAGDSAYAAGLATDASGHRRGGGTSVAQPIFASAEHHAEFEWMINGGLLGSALDGPAASGTSWIASQSKRAPDCDQRPIRTYARVSGDQRRRRSGARLVGVLDGARWSQAVAVAVADESAANKVGRGSARAPSAGSGLQGWSTASVGRRRHSELGRVLQPAAGSGLTLRALGTFGELVLSQFASVLPVGIGLALREGGG